jgi:hypothetical protein
MKIVIEVRHIPCAQHAPHAPHKPRNRGAVLLLAMVFMLMLAVIAATVVQTGVLEFHMAGNDQFQEEAFQRAQAIVSELSRDPDNFSLAGGLGYALCFSQGQSQDQDPDCDENSLNAPVSGVVPEGVELTYRVIRQGPRLLQRFPLREAQGVASGSGLFDAAIFEVDVHVDGSGRRLGSARVVQGIAVRLAASH